MSLQGSKRKTKKVTNLIVICTLIAVVLSVSTYAWFIGMRTVNVSSFDVEIAATDSLLLSLDGSTWDTTVSISKDTVDTVSYAGHSNSWGGRGLIPVSSIGAMDATPSRMRIFEKASIATTKGGYRLMASRVLNYGAGATEQEGYVVFDLFVKNFSGTQYIKALNELDEEDIYLTAESSVTVATSGVENTGIENSVRVAFTQIGRVAGTTTTAATITGITCTSNDDVTGICRTAQIWEPNDREHEANAISWYETSCLARTGANVTLPASYSGTCGTVIDGLAYPTYAVSDDIVAADNVDVYDGPAYNGYTASETLLVPYDSFTDSEKLLTGTNRPTFMKFAPNSITKVRIYIYIEGQDVDNYDFASIGKKIAVKFGFTKERYTEDDIDYNGPDLNEGDGPSAADLTDPVITLIGDATVTVAVGGTYTEQGATASDTKDGDVTEYLVITGTVDTSTAGTYQIEYTVEDAAGNIGKKVRNVVVE